MKFEIGEIAIFVGPDSTVPPGVEVEILEIGVKGLDGNTYDYKVNVDGYPNEHTGYWCVDEQWLRKKPKKRTNQDIEETRQSKYPGGWDKCLWRPEKEKVS